MRCWLENTLATLQCSLDIILSGLRWETCLLYLHDVFMFSHLLKQLIEHLEVAMSLLRRSFLELKLGKCHFV